MYPVDKLMNVSAYCANCGEKIFRHPAGMWRHEFRNFLECDAIRTLGMVDPVATLMCRCQFDRHG